MALDEVDEDDDEFAVAPDERTGAIGAGRAPARLPALRSHGCTRGAWSGALGAALLSLAIFGRQAQLEGALLYDDKAAVLGHPIVQGEAPLSKVWTRDFWGKDELVSKDSHKSFRPLVTLTYVANEAYNRARGHEKNLPYGYHVVSAGLHALVSALVVPTVIAAFGWRERGPLLPVLSALLFATHPVHVESVQNMAGRAEVMMALFYLLGFLAYAHIAIGPARGALPSLAPEVLSGRCVRGIGAALLCTLCSLLCKETGATLPVLCAAWDLLVVVGLEPRHLLAHLRPAADRRDAWLWRRAPAACARYALLATGCVALALWRKSLNGTTEATFARKQNMAVWHPHPFWRQVSIVWVWMEYAYTSFVPLTLGCDWSWPSITTVDGPDDVRLPLVCAYVLGWAALLRAHALRQTSTRALVSLLFALCPFFLASNVLFGVGTCKAERVLYLPALGACMALALGVQALGGALAARTRGKASQRRARLGAWALGLCLVGAYAAQCAWYADVWRTGIGLWEHALRVQEARPAWTRSEPTLHAIGEYGLQLSWAGRNPEAEKALERQLRLSELEQLAQAAPNASRRAGGADVDGSVDMGGYGPLALVYRLNGSPLKAIACADKAIELFERARARGKADEKKRELGLVLAARALAVYLVRPELAMPEMRKALGISNGMEAVVLKLAEQLFQAYARAGLDPAVPLPPSRKAERPIYLKGSHLAGGAPTAGGSGGALAPAGAGLEGALAADPALRALLTQPRVKAMLAELQVNPAAIAKYRDDADLAAVMRAMQQAERMQAGAQPHGQVEPLPESLDDLNAWVEASSRRAPAGGGHPLDAVAAAGDGVPAELGPLPAYATGAGGDPMETKRPARAAVGPGGVAQLLQPELDEAPRLPLGKPPTAAAERAVAAFKTGANLANGGDSRGAVPHYCSALSLFSTCVPQAECTVGILDTLYIKLKLHAHLSSIAVEPARVGHCTAALARRVFARAASAMAAAGNFQVAEYARGVGQLVESELAAKFASTSGGAVCTDAEAMCGQTSVDVLAAFG